MLRRLFLTLLGSYALSIYGQVESQGLGGASTARVGAVTAEVANPFATLDNPALLPAQPDALFGFSFNLRSVTYSAFSNVRLDSAVFPTEKGADEVGDFTLPQHSGSTWSLGMTYPFLFGGRRAGLGLLLSGPFKTLRSFQSRTPYDFSTLRYGGSDSQFLASVGLGYELIREHLYLGTSAFFYVSASGAADISVETENPTGRLVLDVGLNSNLIVGLFGKVGAYQTSLVYHRERDPKFRQELSASARVIRGAAPIEIPLSLQASLYYEPHRFEWDLQRDWLGATFSVGLLYQLWTGYQPSFLVVESEGATTKAPPTPFRNTLSPRVSFEAPFFHEDWSVQGGYQFRPTPIQDFSGGANVLDADTHVIGLSVKHQVPRSWFIPFDFSWSVFGQMHWMNEVQVVKSDVRSIGAPGYVFDGTGYYVGLSLEAAL